MQPDEPYQLPPEFRQQPLSAGVLEDYALCPRKFLLSFFVSREEERRFRGGPAALHQAVRRALLDCYDRGGPPETDAQLVRDSFEAHWQGDLCADSVEEEQLHEQGLRMLQDYHGDHRDQPVAVLATDRRFETVIEGQAFVAVADVVLADQDAAGRGSGLGPRPARLIRFVTSRRPLTAEQLSEDLSAQLLWLLAQEHDWAVGEPSHMVPQVLFYALRKRAAHEVALSPERLAYLRRELASQAARLYREHEFAPVKGKYCRWCRVRSRCPLWRR